MVRMALAISAIAWLFCNQVVMAPAEEQTARPGHDAALLLPNGAFEAADPTDASKPRCWAKPDGLGVQWTSAPQSEGQPPRGKAIRIDTSISEEAMVRQWQKVGLTEWNIPKPEKNPIATTYGLSFYSDAIPVEAGRTYRVEFDFMSGGPQGKLWVRGYGENAGQSRRLWETIVNCRPKEKGWVHFSQLFHPTKYRPNVAEMKVMLFAYHPPGVCWFDNVRIEPVDESR